MQRLLVSVLAISLLSAAAVFAQTGGSGPVGGGGTGPITPLTPPIGGGPGGLPGGGVGGDPPISFDPGSPFAEQIDRCLTPTQEPSPKQERTRYSFDVNLVRYPRTLEESQQLIEEALLGGRFGRARGDVINIKPCIGVDLGNGWFFEYGSWSGNSVNPDGDFGALGGFTYSF